MPIFVRVMLEPDDLREPHVDLVSARPIQPMVGVEQRHERGAGGERARRQTAEELLHDRVRHVPGRAVPDHAGAASWC